MPPPHRGLRPRAALTLSCRSAGAPTRWRIGRAVRVRGLVLGACAPRRRCCVGVVAAALAAAALVPATAAARTRWRWPVRADVVLPFRYSAHEPFRAAQRRGIDIAAPPGVAVRAACSGRVAFAGRVPRRGLGVTVRCGGLAATHLGLGGLAVRRGDRVTAGTRLGVAGPAGRIRLGARRAADRLGYVDPLALLRGAPPPGAPSAPTPLGRAPEIPPAADVGPTVDRLPRDAPPVAPAPSRRHDPHAAPSPTPAAHPREAAPAIPPLAWGGLVILAGGLPVGGVVRRSRRRRVPAVAAVAASAEAE